MTFHAQVFAGIGVVARFGDVVVLAPAECPILDEVLTLAKETPAASLPRKVAGLLAQSDDAPTLAVVSPREDGLAVLLAGEVTLSLVDSTGESRSSGRDASTWVDRIVREPWTSMQLSLADLGLVDARSDLQSGAVTAGGVLLTPTSTVAGKAVMTPPAAVEPAPVTTPEPELGPAPFESFSLTEPVQSEPLPVADAPAAEPEPVGGAVIVQGIECSRQHFNDPTAVYCSVCGISMVHQTHNLVAGPRPPLGVLVLDDGSVFTLDGDYVLGREPENAPEVLAGTAKPLPLDDPEITMSRVHAKLLLIDWNVHLVDASANGSYVAPPGQAEWTKLPSGDRTVLRPGTKVAIGGRTLVFDSHHKL